MNQPEHTFQAFADRFIDRAVMQPMFTTGVDAAHADMRKIGRIASLQARGLKLGLPDVYILQGSPTVSAWIELKYGNNDPTARQSGIMQALERCGVITGVAWSIHDVHAILSRAGFRLHGNAMNIAYEVQAYLDAALMKSLAPKKQCAYKPREKRQSPAHVARMERLRMLPR